MRLISLLAISACILLLLVRGQGFFSPAKTVPPKNETRTSQGMANTPSEVTSKFWDLARTGRLDENQKLCTDYVGEGLSIGIERPANEPCGGATIIHDERLEIVKVESEEIDKDVAQVLLKVKDSDGNSFRWTVHLSNFGSKGWKIYAAYKGDPVRAPNINR